jgi:hypothetical protein
VLLIAGARRGAPGATFFRCTAGAVLLFYGAMSLVGEVKGNWPLAAWLCLAPGAGWCVVEAMTRWRGLVHAWRNLPAPRPRAGWFRKQPETVLQVAWTASWVGGALIAMAIPLLPVLSRTPVAGALVPVYRMMGPPEIAREVAEHAGVLARETGREPFVITTHWGIAGQLAFYLPGRPTVYCATSRMTGGRRTQYDYWEETDLTRAMPKLEGRPAVIFGKPAVFWAPAFKGVKPLGPATGDPRRGRWLAYGYGFVGFGDEANIRLWFNRLHSERLP